MITYNGANYEVRLSMKTVRQIEKVLGEGIVAIVQKTNGMLPIEALVTIAGYGMYNDEGNRISPVQGMDIAEAYIIEAGYANMVSYVVDVIQRDCPFFFQVD